MNAISPRTLAVREQPQSEPVIQCPHCQGDIKLTESLAAPFIKAREAEFRQKEAALWERVALERSSVEEEARRKARLALGTELESKARELAEANELLKLRDEKLAVAQRAQAELIRKQREVEEAKREIELTVESDGWLAKLRQDQRGDLQGIAGRSLQEIEGLELKSLGLTENEENDGAAAPRTLSPLRPNGKD